MTAFFLAAWSLLAPTAARAVYTDRIIQIGIVHGAREVVMTPEGRFALQDEATGQRQDLLPRKAYRVEARGEGLRFGPHQADGQVRLVPQEYRATVFTGSHRYQGPLIVRSNRDDTVTVIEEVGVEDYLMGVLPHEMETNWPVEALKAQAVVARTFAYTQLGKYRKAGFDLTSDTRSQMYGGVSVPSAAVRLAVAATRGEVLGYRGELLNVYYHACCGGHTADYASVWGQGYAPRPLRGVRDGYCPNSPLAHWRVSFPKSDVLVALQNRRLIGGKLRSLRVGRRDAAGYARTFVAGIGAETLVVPSETLRRRLGATELRSVRIRSVRLRRGSVDFEGSGSGHGVGLCQWGARLQAEQGRRYESILRYYFPGSTLSVVDE
ncbi:MAG TPA: hypothetical protein DEB40_12200 [Elusimicrobia bacterium]|nr:hypothetical protein [Elusimicrobiota bacterium]HBT62495.1 hypothetical protein [Elusimicrobiota bacterium]